ncbi:hypothetical protein K2173_025475 [Erythroxylum novogranatense]|uniref:Uncharacterized protein n=1 Tax=Erythroxylum novogranatense TaxID=1862640 RepID=A0AAV8SBN7_9ROSI|nr:hypothetical protein K2173_025475 [Erythroxylum novogranatense]
MNRYFRRKNWYETIHRSGRRRISQVQLGTNQRKKRPWKIKIKLKLKLRLKPKKFFGWLRDSYVNMMLGLSRSQVVNSGYCGPVEDGTGRLGARPIKEYDQKMLIDVYKSMLQERGVQMMARNNVATTTRFGPVVKLAAIAE